MSEEQKPPIIVSLREGEELVFRHIPAGSFRMGHRGELVAEEPVTEVFVEEFWMAETPVTRAQYKIRARRLWQRRGGLRRTSEVSSFR